MEFVGVWKLVLLSGILVATIAFAVPRLIRETDYSRFTTAEIGIEFLALPTATVLGFYVADWQGALIVFIVGRIVWRRLQRNTIKARFTDVSAAQNAKGRVFMRYVALAMCALLIISGNPEYLRIYPVVMLIGVVATATTGMIPARSGKAGSGVKRMALRLGAPLLWVCFVLTSELVWRHGTLEMWMWIFSYQALILASFSVAVVGPMVLWARAGEPGLRDP